MNRANQQVVVQNANMNLIGIRQMEINYFITFFGNFGTQCFFLTAILAGSVSQTPGFECATNCNYFWQITYNVGVSISMVFTAICLLNAVFISVYAQGLGIRGETGSMINAVQGMIAEQTRIVQVFSVGCVTFMIQAIAMWFIVMPWEWATVCAAIGLLMNYYTYYCTVRIYNRFKWDFEKSGWNFDRMDDEQKELSELAPDVVEDVIAATARQTNTNQEKVEQLYRDSVDKGLINVTDSNLSKKSALLRLLNVGTMKKTTTTSPFHKGGDQKVHLDEIGEGSNAPYVQLTDVQSSGTITKGYLQVLIDPSAMGKTSKSFRPFSGGPVWKKYYFIMKGCNMFYYLDETAFVKNASKPINTRPIDLEGYKISSQKMDAPFEFALSPVDPDDIRKIWRFRCENLNDLKSWTDSITKVITSMK